MNNTFYTAPENPTPLDSEEQATDTPVRDPAEVRSTFSKVGLSLLVLTAVMMAMTYVIDYAIYFVAPDHITDWWVTWVLSLIPLYACGLPLMILLLRRCPVAPHNTTYDCGKFLPITVEKPRFHFGHWMILLIISLGYMYIGNLVGTGIMAGLSAITGYDYANALNTIIDESPLWMTLIGTCICAPLGEEFIFRKLLIDRTRRYGDGVSILLSGLLFGLFHGNLFQFFYAFLLGMVLAYIYTRSGNYWWCAAMHAVVNLLGAVVLPALQGLLPTDITATLTPVQILVSNFLVFWIYGLIIAAIVLTAVLWKQKKLSRGSVPLTRRDAAAVLVNPGMLLCIILLLLILASNLILPVLVASLPAA